MNAGKIFAEITALAPEVLALSRLRAICRIRQASHMFKRIGDAAISMRHKNYVEIRNSMHLNANPRLELLIDGYGVIAIL